MSLGEDTHGSSSVLACLDGASHWETVWLGGLSCAVPSSLENLPGDNKGVDQKDGLLLHNMLFECVLSSSS